MIQFLSAMSFIEAQTFGFKHEPAPALVELKVLNKIGIEQTNSFGSIVQSFFALRQGDNSSCWASKK